MRQLMTLMTLAGLTIGVTACGPMQNATNGAAGFANQAVDSLPTPQALHQGSQSPTNQSSAMGLNNSGMANNLGSLNMGNLAGNSTVQVDTASKTIRLILTARTSTSAADARAGGSATPVHNNNQRMTSISVPLGWTLNAAMRMNQGANTHGGAAALTVVPYGPGKSTGAVNTGTAMGGTGNTAWTGGPVQTTGNMGALGSTGATNHTRTGAQNGVMFKAQKAGIYAVVMHQTGVPAYVMTLVSVTPTIKLPVVSFPAS